MQVKQVIVIRKDLNMRKGKLISQGCHASLKVFLDRLSYCDHGELHITRITKEMEEWIDGSFTKVCVSVDSEQELLDIYQQAKDQKIPCSLIIDNGLTEFNNVPTKTCCAVGPDDSSKIDLITGKLKLL